MTALDLRPILATEPLITSVPGVAPRTSYTSSAAHRSSSLTGLAGLRYGFHPGEPDEGQPHDLPHREPGATLPPEEQAEVITNRESIRAAYEGEGQS